MTNTIEPLDLSRPGNMKPLRVGHVVYGINPGSRIAHPHGAERMAYVLTADGAVLAVAEAGEVPIPAHLQAGLKSKYFGP